MTGILAAVDNSQFAQAVMMRAAQMASAQRSELTLLSVVKPGLGTRNTMVSEEAQLAAFHRELIYKCFPKGQVSIVSSSSSSGAVYKSTIAGFKIHSMIEHGDPAERICAVADRLKADLVIVGNRGLGSAGTFVLGSVSQRVVQTCSRPVLVVKERSSDPSGRENLDNMHQSHRGSTAEH